MLNHKGFRFNTIFLVMIMCLFSCSDVENSDIKPNDDIVSDIPDDSAPPSEEPIEETTQKIYCDFDLSKVNEGENVVINCKLDLEGKTISLPDNITLSYNNGSIVNGTLLFTATGKIDGRLLNLSLKLEGNAQLINNEFEFIPSLWEITEGEVDQTKALDNKNNIQTALNTVKKLQGNTFKIDKMNAFFEVGNYQNLDVFRSVDHAIKIPSDFNVIMSKENTFLKVFPNDSPNYALMAIFDSKNVTIDGGNLLGDRDKHAYTDNSPHEHGHCLQIRSGVNVLIKNCYFGYGSGDGIDINSIGFTFQPTYKPSNDIKILSNTFDTNRRNNISITDGNNIFIENNLLLNAGIHTVDSRGIDPGFGIDLESVRDRDSNGELIFFQRSEDIFIRNNTERGSRVGAITAAISYDVLIENNITEGAIGYSFGNGITITENKITAKENNGDGKSGIFAGKIGGDATVYNNIVSNNEINGYSVGITVHNRDTEITGNTISNFTTGLFLKKLKNVQFNDNILNSDQPSSKGIFVNLTSLDDVSFSNNKINVKGNSLVLSSVNSSSSYKFTFDLNEFKSVAPILISKTTGLLFKENTLNNGIQLFDSNDITFSNNDITSNNNHGIYLRNKNKDVAIKSNKIQVATSNFNCIEIQNSTNKIDLSIVENECKI